MADRKYILTNEIMDFFGRKLYRIKAVKDFGDVKAGDLGGWLITVLALPILIMYFYVRYCDEADAWKLTKIGYNIFS